MRRFLEKLEPWIFYLFIFAIPFEKRLIVAEWLRPFHEWTSAFVYGTDILLIILFVLWLLRSIHNSRRRISNFQFTISNPNLWLILFFVVCVLSVFNSRIPGLSFYQLLKLAEFILLYFYAKNNIGKIFPFQKILPIVIASGFVQAVVGIWQFIKQSAVGLGILGESPITVNGYGVAAFVSDAGKYLRAYGITPHPNVLAIWLLLAIFAFYAFYVKTADKKPGYFNLFMLMIYAVLVFGLLVTFSRVAIAFYGFGSVVLLAVIFFKKDFSEFWISIKSRVFEIIVATLIVGGIFTCAYWPLVSSRIHISSDDEAVTQRVFYNNIAGSVAVSHPIFGIGMGQFVPDMMSKFKYLPPNVYQPAHNVYLLVASEEGFAGLAVFLVFLFFTFQSFIIRTRLKQPAQFLLLILISCLLLSALFDHLLWTLQQGSLVLWISLAFLTSGVFRLLIAGGFDENGRYAIL